MPMLLIGASYSQGTHDRLRQANRVKRQLLSQNFTVSAAQAPRRRKQGGIQEMVLTVLSESPSPLSVRQVHALIEERLGGPVSRDTVCSCLTVGVRRGREGLRRVGFGVYEVEGREKSSDPKEN